mgnify:CR=1 FL=1
MATLNWPDDLADVLVSGAPIREKGLVGWWSMNRTALDGAVLRDDSGNGNDGTIYGATPVNGVSGKALSFDGVNDYVSIASNGVFGVGSITTISLWVKPTGTSQYIFSYPDIANNNRFYLQLANTTTLQMIHCWRFPGVWFMLTLPTIRTPLAAGEGSSHTKPLKPSR